MFSGIVEGAGVVRSVARARSGMRLRIAARFTRALRRGASVCVSGACLTVVGKRAGVFEVDVVPETLARTTLGRLRQGDRVNLERSLRLGDRVEGHLVQGHVEAVGIVRSVTTEGGGTRVRIIPPPRLLDAMIPKGSVAVDGVSLTIAALGRRSFAVALVPHTLRVTTLGVLRPGSRVNLETDFLGRYAGRMSRSFRRRR